MSQGLEQEFSQVKQISQVKEVCPIFNMHQAKEFTKKVLSVSFLKNICTFKFIINNKKCSTEFEILS